MHLVWLLAWRFRSDKRQNGFISFISASSTFGIGLGCFVLIVLLSVMNGFERELKDKLLSVIPHAEFKSVYPEGIENWQQEVNLLRKHPEVTFVEPYIKATGMLQKGNKMKAVEVTGLNMEFAELGILPSLVEEEQWQQFKADHNAVLLGAGVIEKLGLRVGDRVQILLPQLSSDLSLSAPKTLNLHVIGSIDLRGELSNHIGFIHMSLAAEAQNIENGAQGIRLRYRDPFTAPKLTREIGFELRPEVYMSNWTISDGNLYQDIQLVRAVVYLALTLVIAVACFNIVSTLVMAVNEKKSEIAMLKSMGAKNGLIVFVFMLQGTFNGLIGTAFGVLLGVFMALNLANIASIIEHLLGVQFLSGDIYFIDFLPSELRWHEVYMTASIAVLLSILATLYPAFKAARINPAKVLGH
ncbi:lipoprotein-releasing ABC transporter permease subunit LolE [Paraglaciecola aquimarina]|uniref:Lipoprotein-releasing ABC transporter permease subunit LolE n=1 Tax=Paraglaciecola aquimarina TaxID=1235557 RepID=A0ABU3SXV9_9ALTE|nr:lipoprotein-releasing ABC transporter permease subunit LolE [Paraglaciecola aquimarina]MDU0354854.1 lipoprotein-releasing ABC transporter permease subunit LolE [Paraglaciecola aquimarina]